MGKASCEENQDFSKAINLNKKHANTLRKAEKNAGSGQVRKILLGGLIASQEATVKLARMQDRHQKMCDECQKGPARALKNSN
jgi:hypothetical protein